MTILIALIILALICMFSIPLLIHFCIRADELEQYISDMRCENCEHCAKRVFPTQSGTKIFYQCYNTETDTWEDTESYKLCENYSKRTEQT